MLIAFALVGGGCAAHLEEAASQHEARAVALDREGKPDAALHEREEAVRDHQKLEWQTAADRRFVPPMTAF